MWNRLPTSVVNQLTVNDFKKELDNYFQNFKTHGYNSITNPYAP